MSEPLERNKRLVRRLFEEVFNRGAVELLDALVAADYLQHSPVAAGGREGLRAYVVAVRAAIPDLRLEVLDLIAEADRVCARTIARGTPERELMGIPAGAGPIEVPGLDLFRIEDDQLAEHWDAMETTAAMHRLGAAGAR